LFVCFVFCLGDIYPKSQYETLFIIFVVFVGIGIYASVTATIASLASNMDIAAGSYQHNLDEVKDLMARKRIPQERRQLVREYYKSLWISHKGVEENVNKN